MNEETERQLRAEIAALKERLRQAGRDVDDRFRGAVDPIGEDVRQRLGVPPSRDWTVAIRVLAGVVVVCLAYILWRWIL